MRSHGFQKAGRNDSYLGSQSKAQLAIELRHDYNFSLSLMSAPVLMCSLF